MKRCRVAWSASFLGLLLALPCAGQEPERAPPLKIPAGRAPVVDGAPGADEWEGAARFDIAAGDDVYGRVRFLRVARQLFVAYESRVGPGGIGIRFTFTDPMSGFETLALIVPADPPKPPLILFRRAKGEQADRVPAATCDLRFDFARPAAYTFEMRVPLDLLEFGRRKEPRLFAAAVWDINANRKLGTYPNRPEGLLSTPPPARVVPDGDWGADVPLEAPAPAPQPALSLLEKLERERRRPAGEVPVMRAYMGWKDGRRQDEPLARIQQRLEQLSAEYPGYASLRAELIWAYMGRSMPEEALRTLDGIGKDFPWLTLGSRHHLFRVELLRASHRLEEARAYLEANAKRIDDKRTFIRERRLLAYLSETARLEQEYRKEDEDLPRVQLVTTKGEIVLELFEDDAPNAVANFIALVEKGAYDKTRFHWVEGGRRVIGGDPLTRDNDPHNDGFGHPGYFIEAEPGRRRHLAFMVSFADLRRIPRTEGSTFDIHLVPFPGLDGRSTVFGRVVEGEATVRKLEYYDRIEQARVVRKREHAYEPHKREAE